MNQFFYAAKIAIGVAWWCSGYTITSKFCIVPPTLQRWTRALHREII